MCEFCHKHGEGRKWYLEANNYSEDLLSDLRRRNFIIDFIKKPESLRRGDQRLNELDNAPGFIQRAIIRRVSNKMKKKHFGQVVPIEEVERIFDFVTSVARYTCICRHVTLGSEQRYCERRLRTVFRSCSGLSMWLRLIQIYVMAVVSVCMSVSLEP